ncbi:unnamed protein product, partial [Allacma fusca]
CEREGALLKTLLEEPKAKLYSEENYTANVLLL